jgi:hypothetical protein
MDVAAWSVNSPYQLKLLRRAFLFWAPLRLLLYVLAAGSGASAAMGTVGAVLLAIAVATLCAIDARFMRETIFQANLGTPTWAPAAAGVAVTLAAFAAELLMVSLAAA